MKSSYRLNKHQHDDSPTLKSLNSDLFLCHLLFLDQLDWQHYLVPKPLKHNSNHPTSQLTHVFPLDILPTILLLAGIFYKYTIDSMI